MKIFVGFLAMFSTFFINVVVMVFGWGLEPQSWGWIFAGWLASIFAFMVLTAVTD